MIMSLPFLPGIDQNEGGRRIKVKLRELHTEQARIKNSKAKRIVVRAGRRGGKTTVAADIAVEKFLNGERVLYAVPTNDQVDRFWYEVKRALKEPLEAGFYYKNETKHSIELTGTTQRIRAKTAYNEDTLRGDYADYLILDEYQLMHKDVWELVGVPMLMDNDGDCLFIFTERAGLRGRHARELVKKAKENKDGRWEFFTFSSFANEYISREALDEVASDMPRIGFLSEIVGLQVEDSEGAMWRKKDIHHVRVTPEFERIVVGVDPPGGVLTECGIIVAGSAWLSKKQHAYIIADYSCSGQPAYWAGEVIKAFYNHKAGIVIGEVNFGGAMVGATIASLDEHVPFESIHVSTSKRLRAEPVAAKYQGKICRVLHIGEFKELEEEMCGWVPDSLEKLPSPNRLDAMVIAVTELLGGGSSWADVEGVGKIAGYKNVYA